MSMTSAATRRDVDLAADVERGAHCRGTGSPDDWHPSLVKLTRLAGDEASDAGRRAWEKRAAHLCAPCPVRLGCLELALRYEETAPDEDVHGIWGGLLPWQRRGLINYRRRLAAQSRPEAA